MNSSPARLSNLFGVYSPGGYVIQTAGRETIVINNMDGNGVRAVKKACLKSGKAHALRLGVKWCGMHRDDKLWTK